MKRQRAAVPSSMMKMMEKEMKQASKEMRYEEAAKLRDELEMLNHLSGDDDELVNDLTSFKRFYEKKSPRHRWRETMIRIGVAFAALVVLQIVAGN